MKLQRHPANPIVRPGDPRWRRATTYNPSVIRDEDGVFWMIERASPGLHPHITWFGLLRSEDGVKFELAEPEPVLTAKELGFPYGSVQDPRVVRMDGKYLMTFALQPEAWITYPTGWGLPRGMLHDLDHYLEEPLTWIADRLNMGHRSNASRNVSAFAKRSDIETIGMKERMHVLTG